MARMGYCIPCGEDRRDVDATVMVGDDPMCDMHARMMGDGLVRLPPEERTATLVMTKLPEPIPLLEAMAEPVEQPIRRCLRGCGKQAHRGRCFGAAPAAPLAALRKYRKGAEMKEAGKMSEFFSKTECGCGCENLLTQAIVDRGWKYIRGHKPKRAETAAAQLQRQAKTKPGRVVELGEGSLKTSLAFLRAQYDELNKEENIALAELGVWRQRFESAHAKKMRLIPLLDALAEHVEPKPEAKESAA